MRTHQDVFTPMRGHIEDGCVIDCENGDVLTLKADMSGIVNCLSQRANEFGKTAEAQGLKLVKKWVKDSKGRNVCKAYRLVRG